MFGLPSPFSSANRYSVILQVTIVVFLCNAIFVFIYLKSGYRDSISLSQCLNIYSAEARKALLSSPLSIASMEDLTLYQKQTEIVYFKTHKTASTTVGSIFFRFGAQHGLKFYNPHNHYYYLAESDDPKTTYNISLFHHKPAHFELMDARYKKIVLNGKFVSIMRDPVRRYLSHYHYYNQPLNHSFDEYLTWTDYNNYMTKDFGIHNQSELHRFLVSNYHQFFFLITEKLDESLVLLKNTWNWSLQDILYISLNKGCETGFRDFDLKPMSCLPTIENLTDVQLATMRKNNNLDLEMYERAERDLNTKLDAQPQSFWDEVLLFKKMQKDLQDACTTVKPAPPICVAFLMMDTQYEAMINDAGQVLNYSRIHIGYPMLV